jgi:hypothetical protein
MDIKDCRHEVKQFAIAMELKLRENDHKRGWQDCDYEYLTDKIDIELEELVEALEAHTNYVGDSRTHKAHVLGVEAQQEAVDVANFAMMVYDKLEHNLVMSNTVIEAMAKKVSELEKNETSDKKRSRFESIEV